MAGIYLHIPFCKSRCIYCDFYSTTHSSLQARYVNALCRELTERRDYLRGEPIETIYIGGGTPSQLSEEQLTEIFRTLQDVYGLERCQEITLEANPDDLTPAYVEMLRTLPVNRISMGIQSFDDRLLRLLNRRHNARQAEEAVARCRHAGFSNISIDLIYGLPGEDDDLWNRDLQRALTLGVEHLSAYHLSYEQGTRLYRMREQGQIEETDEESSLRFFRILTDTLSEAGYEHYEISNFCRPGMHSRHNSSYWRGIPYLGCGASAHSYRPHSRQWNVASVTDYIHSMENGGRSYEEETLNEDTRYNEFIMTRLRTARGIDLALLGETFGADKAAYCRCMALPHITHGLLCDTKGWLKLTRQGIFLSDDIISDLMYVE